MKSNNDYITMKGPFYTHEGVKWDVIVNDVSARSMTPDEILSMLRERAKLEVADRDKEAYDSAKKEKKGVELPSELSKVYQEERKRQQEVDYDHE